MKIFTPGKRRQIDRRGATAVEFALVLPIFVLFLMASFEFGWLNVVRHTADNAAYEAARYAMVPGATADEATQEAKSILKTIGVRERQNDGGSLEHHFQHREGDGHHRRADEAKRVGGPQVHRQNAAHEHGDAPHRTGEVISADDRPRNRARTAAIVPSSTSSSPPGSGTPNDSAVAPSPLESPKCDFHKS